MPVSDTARSSLEDLLERERSLILAGRLSDLARLAPLKESLIETISALRDPKALGRLKAAARRNEALLAAAATGVRSALNRVREIRGQAGTLQTDGADGSRARVSTVRGSLERRA